MKRRLLATLAALTALPPLGAAAAGAQAPADVQTPVGAPASPDPETLSAASLPVARGAAIGGDLPVVGDWDGNGTTTIGVRRGATFHLRNSNTTGQGDTSFDYGLAGDTPLTGDWDGNGTTTVGVRRGATFHLRTSNSAGAADVSFDFGLPGDVPVTGDWDGNGTTTVGVWRQGTFYLRNSNSTGPADVVVSLGVPTDMPVVGDWDGNGTTTIGVRRDATFYVRNSNTTGQADAANGYGMPDDVPVAGDWDGNGTDTPGVRRGTAFLLSDSFWSSSANAVFDYGDATITPSEYIALAGGEVAVMQQELARLGLPLDPTTGIDDDRTRQAACGWRWALARPGGRGPLQSGEALAALATPSLLLPPTGQITFWVVRDCQLGFEAAPDGTVVAVHLVSTGMPGYTTPAGRYQVWAREHGWVDSSSYPTYDGRAMLNPAYFIGWAYAVHGSLATDPNEATWPASHGCIRVPVSDVSVTDRIQQVIVV